jgi:uncharacterized protein YcfJ
MKTKFAPISIAVAAAMAVSAVAAPTFAQPRREYRYDEANSYYRDACHQERSNRRVAGGVLGAIAGGVIGSNVSGRHNRGTGTVVGAVAGAAVGSNVGGHSVRCDGNGAYWSRNETYGDNASYYYRGRHEDRWYGRNHCRWARDWRGDYVRVCPDSRGHYRLAY